MVLIFIIGTAAYTALAVDGLMSGNWPLFLVSFVGIGVFLDVGRREIR